VIAEVRCNLHRKPLEGCQRCGDAARITAMILHEHGDCGGADYCFMCSLTEDA
jgi:hypothetical protein